MIWSFIQDQILGMKWLNGLIGNVLSSLGLDLSDKWAGSLQFFIYDVIKITILLCFLIFIISYIQSYFPPERSKKILGRFHGIWANMVAAPSGNCDTVLLLLIHTAFHRLYKCRTASWCNIFISHLITNG